MLYEEQAAELLRRCEALAGRRLPQVRGNLRKAGTRAEAVWELLVLEAAAYLGPVECEPPEGGPDIRLTLPSGRPVSIEVTYVHPRSEDMDHRCHLVSQWMYEASTRFATPGVVMSCDFFEERRTSAGAHVTLPAEHEKRIFLADPEVASFLASVRASPSTEHFKRLSTYSVSLRARPKRSATDTITSSTRPAFDAPTSAEQHAGYRAVRAKLDQHKLDEPYVICIGSDVSRVLSTDSRIGPEVRLVDALRATIRPSGRLSAILLVTIESQHAVFGRFERTAKARLFPVEDCRHPLGPNELAALGSIDFNRWTYTFPLTVREPKPAHRSARVAGPLSIGYTAMGNAKISIPASVLVDALAGRSSLAERYGSDGGSFDHKLMRCFADSRRIIGCQFKPGDIEKGLDACVEFEISASHDPVFWGKNSNET
jgi:hypothetical protein